MFVKLDYDLVESLRCPLCKGTVEMVGGGEFVCEDCGTGYPKRSVVQGRHKEYVFDFRIPTSPAYCIPAIARKWADVQEEYKKYASERISIDDLTVYLNEIGSVEEIYVKEFSIKGKVLDVGGGQGRLRHFLKDKDVPLYVSVDPYLEIFQNIESQPNLLKAYPCLRKPCNFLSCYAEHLPFNRNTFNWVHMRSVLDHFQDPYIALKEAYRVLKVDGTLCIGLTVRGGRSSLKTDNNFDSIFGLVSTRLQIKSFFRCGGLTSFARRAVGRIGGKSEKEIPDDHMFRWIYEDLIDLVRTTGFNVVKEHWQKPPFTMCIYLSAKKRSIVT